ncbi:NADH:flavin oxidoreductase/NADH oxidase [Sphingobacterium sp. lm-10]|uniref:NADH:flavin oxidoreductase/NADH oxidase n=1 Tax=Sphingobacterium sp. lm-10 TaxID=2944904 RepID=UPI00202003DC|nr:NADH:flavin oxidoreductase/NADH oxidase [Sphingobacterium sp. lm-10]MCL7989300.1 NADH:flavin oxidoreductase/NADH oxidase [Sphingobacterium sp. lm-10]
MSKLFSPITIKSITLKNRIVTSPMCMYSAEDGFATDWHLVHYGTRAMGGAGTVMLEASAVRPDGRISVGDLGIYKDGHIDGLTRIAKFIKDNGSVPAIQLAHAGRKGSTWVAGDQMKVLHTKEEGGWTLLAPSAIAFSSDTPTPREMNNEDILQLQHDFRAAAKRAKQAGFEWIEIHSAHGYLVNEFLSPLSNKRTDSYGGSRENRARFLLEIVEAVKEEWPVDLPISVRISATDWTEEGWTLADSKWLTEKLVEAGVDIIDVSSGGVVGGIRIPIGPGYQLPLASGLKSSLGETAVVGTVGLITNAQQAETILVNGDADLVFLARELLRNPYFPLAAAAELGEKSTPPVQYTRAFV